jgi:hypothetical protein
MIFTITVRNESLSAKGACKCFFSGMSSHMLKQAALVLKLFCATIKDTLELA